MNVTDPFERPARNIVWHSQQQHARCGHERNAIAILAEGGILRQGVKCGRLEAE